MKRVQSIIFMNAFGKVALCLTLILSFLLAYQQHSQAKTNPTPSEVSVTKETPAPLYFVAFVYYQDGGKAKMQEFRKKVAPLWKKYDLEHLYTIKVAQRGAIVGFDSQEQPDEIFVQVARDPAKFGQYVQDPAYQKIKDIREQGVRKMTYIMGTNIDLPKDRGNSQEKDRLYGLALINYKPGGETKMQEFSQQAAPLFKKYGMHVDRFITPLDKGAVIGQANDFTLPDEVRIFFLDQPGNLNRYVSDPEYQKIKGIREEGVADYSFFMGSYEPGM